MFSCPDKFNFNKAFPGRIATRSLGTIAARIARRGVQGFSLAEREEGVSEDQGRRGVKTVLP